MRNTFFYGKISVMALEFYSSKLFPIEYPRMLMVEGGRVGKTEGKVEVKGLPWDFLLMETVYLMFSINSAPSEPEMKYCSLLMRFAGTLQTLIPNHHHHHHHHYPPPSLFSLRTVFFLPRKDFRPLTSPSVSNEHRLY